jgi:hypothetical protein
LFIYVIVHFCTNKDSNNNSNEAVRATFTRANVCKTR